MKIHRVSLRLLIFSCRIAISLQLYQRNSTSLALCTYMYWLKYRTVSNLNLHRAVISWRNGYLAHNCTKSTWESCTTTRCNAENTHRESKQSKFREISRLYRRKTIIGRCTLALCMHVARRKGKQRYFQMIVVVWSSFAKVGDDLKKRP